MSKLFLAKEIIQSAIEQHKTMMGAAAYLKIQFSTFKRIAKLYGLYSPNPGGKGTKRPRLEKRFLVEDALKGLHPQWPTYQLKLELLKKGIFENKCSECKITDWQNKPIVIELDHIDGDRTNHKLENLRMLCPNCHSQTSTFRSKKRNT